VLRVRMATGTQRSHIAGENGRPCVFHTADTVCLMTRGAGGDFLIAFGEAYTVNARGVLGCLVDPLGGSELPHERGIAVASSAGRDDLQASGPAAVTARRILRARFILRRRIAAMAIHAAEATFVVNVGAKRNGRAGQL